MNKTILGVLVAALVVGGGLAFAFNMNRENIKGDSVNNSSSEMNKTVSAGDLRVSLNNALREHVNLAGVALRNVYTDSPDADAAVKALDDNSVEVAGLVGVAYGDEANDSFLKLWRQHITFFANYTTAAKSGDKEGMDQASKDLDGYTEAASTFFSQANPNFKKSDLIENLGHHKMHVIAVINKLGDSDFDGAYKDLGDAADQAGKIADYLASGIAKQMPDKFAGNPSDPGVDLRVSLNNALREHVELAGVALRNVFTGAPDTDASVSALDKNSQEVAGLVGVVYGKEAEVSFLKLWRQHITFFANYTTAAKSGDKEGMDQASKNLDGYTEAASTFFSQANPNLSKDEVKSKLGDHKNHVLEVVDMIGAGDFEGAYKALGEADDHIGAVTADALAKAIAEQYPEKF